VIGRLLRGGGEPRSIFEHIDAHVRPDVPGLSEGGADLPDEQELATSDLRFAPGAEERIFGTDVASDDDLEAVERIYLALAALARKPSQANRRRLRELFREGNVRARIDPLRDRLTAESPPNAVELYPELRELFLRSGYRDEVKYAMALLSGFGRPEDADLFRVVGRHEEFTVYAAVALATVTGDPLGEWLGLLPHVSGWGRNELAELILREPRSRAVRDQLAHDGLGIGNALELAVGCRLDELLAYHDVDDGVIAGALGILHSLAVDRDSPAGLTDYPEAGPAVEALLARLAEHAGGLAEFVAVGDIRRAIDEADGDERGRLEGSGFDAERRARVLACSAAYLGGEHWRALAEAALQRDDPEAQWLGSEAATRLGVDLRDHLRALIAADPGDASAWCRLCADAGEARMREALELALSLWDLSEIARGAASELFPEPPGPLSCVSYLLQELPRFPGAGGELLQASLQSPFIAHRNMALRALSRWEHLPAETVERLALVRAADPDDDVRERAARVLAGEEIADR
jgi:hypothetical protein